MAEVVIPQRPKRPSNIRRLPQASSTPAAFTGEEQDVLKVLAETHPQYKDRAVTWRTYLDCYEGTNLQRYLHQHLRESTKSVDLRRARLYYLNYCQPVIDLYTHYIFSKPAIRKESPEEVLQTQSHEGLVDQYMALAGGLGELGGLPANEDLSEWRQWLRDVDRKGQSMDRFMAETSRYAGVFGLVYVLIDLPQTGSKLETEQQRLDLGIRPYLSMYFPTEVPDWGLDADNRLIWIRFREPLEEKVDPFKSRDKIKSQKSKSMGQRGTPPARSGTQNLQPLDGIYRTWTRDQWFVHKVEDGHVEELNSGPHPVGEVPVVPVYNKRLSSYPFLGQSLISDISRINISILNWSSLIDEEIYQKTLNILAIQRQSTDKAEISIGSDNVLEWDGGAAPFFLTPSSDPGSFIATMIDRCREEIYRLAKLGGGLGLVSPQNVPSGTAQAFEFNETNRTLAERADEIESAENAIHRMWHRWLGLDWQGVVDYPEDFSVESFADELEIAMKAKQQVRSPTFKREVEKKIARKMMHNVNPMMQNVFGLEIDLLPELVIGPFGPMYFTPDQNPQATPTTVEDISRSPLEQGPQDEGNAEEAPGDLEQVDQQSETEKAAIKQAQEAQSGGDEDKEVKPTAKKSEDDSKASTRRARRRKKAKEKKE